MVQASTSSPWITVTAVSLGWLFSAVDIVLLILFQEEIAADLGVTVQALRGSIGVGLFGSALGGLFFAQLGDRLGRVKALSLSIILYSIATGAMALSSSIESLYAFRLLAGIGTGAEWSIGFALLSEVWSRHSRGTVGGLVAAMFNLGTFVAIALYHSSLGWRWSFGVMAGPAIFSIFLRFVLPESPLWIKLQEQKQAGLLSAELEARMQGSPILAAFHGDIKWRTIHLIVMFAIMNIGFYSFSTVFINFLKAEVSSGGLQLSRADQLPFHLALNVSSLVSILLAGWISDLVGRKKASFFFCFLGGTGFMLLSSKLGGGAGTTELKQALLLPFAICCAGFGINGVLGIFTPELFPTELRSTGPGVSQNLGKGVGGLLGPTLAGSLIASYGYTFVLSLPGWSFMLLALLIWKLPEVGGRDLTLEESPLTDEK